MSDGSDQRAAMESLGAPAGRDVVDWVRTERLGPPHLRAVGAEAEMVVELEAQLAAERTARRQAEASANEMALLVARVRTELAEAVEAREAAEAAAHEMAGLVAQEHRRARKTEDELRLAWAQVPMIEQGDLNPGKTLSQRAHRARRALKR